MKRRNTKKKEEKKNNKKDLPLGGKYGNIFGWVKMDKFDVNALWES